MQSGVPAHKKNTPSDKKRDMKNKKKEKKDRMKQSKLQMRDLVYFLEDTCKDVYQVDHIAVVTDFCDWVKRGKQANMPDLTQFEKAWLIAKSPNMGVSN